ncbi:MAG TPA: hypothetical protein EYP14_12260 [Planctomycetaceae bacterium]|nr:hypothetical protein [Planctomycetaceae bacterium]
MAVIWWLLSVVSESWWLSCALTYLPRRPYALPALVLLFAGLCCDRRTFWLSVAAAGLALGPIAGFQLPAVHTIYTMRNTTSVGKPPPLKIVTCNVQQFRPDFATVLQEVGRENPDVVAFQECVGDHPLLKRFFRGWNRIQVGELWVGSKYPLRELGRCRTTGSGRRTAIAVLIDARGQAFVLVNLHFMTPRHTLRGLTLKGLLSGDDLRAVESMIERRSAEAGETWRFVEEVAAGQPVVICGDFNTPSSSSLYRAYWSNYTNAFDVAGFGYGFTAPCASHRHWPDGWPWIRVDHILVSSDWRVLSCRVGRKNGSDHRLVAAQLTQRRDTQGNL